MNAVTATSGVPGQSVPNYLVQSILATVFCCLPFGIVGIIFASQVNSKLAAGDTRGAIEASNKARTWTLVSFICGLAAVGLWFVITVLGVLAGGAQNMN